MKEFYVAPEAEIIRFVAEENIANETTSELDWAVDQGDGDFVNQDKWF